MLRYFVPLAVFLVLTAFLFVGLGLDPKKVPSPLIGRAAPVFTLNTVRDPDARLSDQDLQGKVSLVNVWATWCVSCRAEHPILMDLAERKVVDIYGLNYKDSREQAVRWLNRFGDPYSSSAYDPDGRTGIDWGVYGTPETFLIDRQGIVRYKHIGPITPNDLNTKILPLIAALSEGQG